MNDGPAGGGRNERWSAGRMLEAWGLRECGGSLKNPLATSRGGTALGCDEEWQASRYVEGIAGFAEARPVLLWVYAHGRPASEFAVRRPGEGRLEALRRLGWEDFALVRPEDTAEAVRSEFFVELSDALAERPFVPMHVASGEESAEEIARTAGLNYRRNEVGKTA